MSETSQWAPPATRYRCPISACKWTHDDAPDMSEARGKTIEEASAAVIRAHLLRSEKVIEAHLRTHDLIDWAREIARLRGELAREKRDGGLIVTCLLRRLDGSAFISDAELQAGEGMLTRTPGHHGFRLEVTP